MTGNLIIGDEFAQFRKTFFDECDELLTSLDERLSTLHEEIADNEALNAIFRAVHSIKAGAGAFGFTQLVAFTHKYEAILDQLRDGRIEQSAQVVAVLINAGDILAGLVEAVQTGQSIPEDYGSDVLRELELLLNTEGSDFQQATPEPRADDPPDGESKPVSYRVKFKPHAELFRHANEPLLLIRELKRLGDVSVSCDTSRLPPLSSLEPEDAYLSWSLEIVAACEKAAIAEVFEFVEDDCDLEIEVCAVAEVASANDAVTPSPIPHGTGNAEAGCAQRKEGAKPADTAAKVQRSASVPVNNVQGGRQENAPMSGGISSIRVDLDRVDRLVNVVGELVITQSMVSQQSGDAADRGDLQTSQGHDELATLVRELQECVMAIRMQPVKSVFARMPRLVREVSSKLNKQVRLLASGEQTEVDKTVIEELADPLTHMIRNAIDHGLEDPASRKAKGKSAEGTIKLAAKHAGGNILIQVTDDGAGLNRKLLLQKAIDKGVVAQDSKLSDDEIDDLIFAPGFSTAKEVTDVSGRGVGMDVVRRNINKLGGRISVQSVLGRGTRFTLTIPLTLAVLDGMLVAIGREKYILPLTSIVESFRPERSQVRALAGGGQVVSIRGEFIRVIYLHRLFEVPGAIADPWDGLVVVLETANGSKIGVVVDELVGQQQVVVKSLQENFDPVAGVSGATILGNGKVALILDIEQLRAMPVSDAKQDVRKTCSDRRETDNKGLSAPVNLPMRNDAVQPAMAAQT